MFPLVDILLPLFAISLDFDLKSQFSSKTSVLKECPDPLSDSHIYIYFYFRLEFIIPLIFTRERPFSFTFHSCYTELNMVVWMDINVVKNLRFSSVHRFKFINYSPYSMKIRKFWPHGDHSRDTKSNMNKMLCTCMRCLGSLFITTSKTFHTWRSGTKATKKTFPSHNICASPVPSETCLHSMRCFTRRTLRHCSKYKHW